MLPFLMSRTSSRNIDWSILDSNEDSLGFLWVWPLSALPLPMPHILLYTELFQETTAVRSMHVVHHIVREKFTCQLVVGVMHIQEDRLWSAPALYNFLQLCLLLKYPCVTLVPQKPQFHHLVWLKCVYLSTTVLLFFFKKNFFNARFTIPCMMIFACDMVSQICDGL